MSRRCILILLLVGVGAVADDNVADEKKLNVVFLIIDDLRTELSVYGKAHIKSPNIDQLASQGVVFENAYANVPVCGASRASLMTGIRPTRSRFVRYYSRIDKDSPEATSLFRHLKNQGYHTESIGKVMHFRTDDVGGWSAKPWHPRYDHRSKSPTRHRDYQSPENIRAFRKYRKGPAFEAADVPDNAYFDGKIAERAIASLSTLSGSKQPFFLSIGFVKPHLPFNAPKRYWDLYRPEEIVLADNARFPKDAPEAARHLWGEMRKYDDVPPAPENIPDELARKLIHGYYAGVSYSDAQVGKVLKALDRLGLAEDTLVFMFGDHGWSLGEHSLWVKHSPFDVATHTPLIVRIPGTKSVGNTTGLVEFVDIYPTVLELIGLPRLEQLQGESFVAQLEDLEAPGKAAVFPRWRGGEVIKTRDFALTEWFDEAGKVSARMLYDHRNDRDETVNVAESADYKLITDDLHQQLLRMMESR